MKGRNEARRTRKDQSVCFVNVVQEFDMDKVGVEEFCWVAEVFGLRVCDQKFQVMIKILRDAFNVVDALTRRVEVILNKSNLHPPDKIYITILSMPNPHSPPRCSRLPRIFSQINLSCYRLIEWVNISGVGRPNMCQLQILIDIKVCPDSRNMLNVLVRKAREGNKRC